MAYNISIGISAEIRFLLPRCYRTRGADRKAGRKYVQHHLNERDGRDPRTRGKTEALAGHGIAIQGEWR